MNQNLRQIALSILQKDPHKVFLKEELSYVEGKLLKRERSFLQQILYGCLRWRYTLDHLIQQFCHISRSSPEYFLLQMGFYQLLFMPHVPQYAILNETVALGETDKKKKFLNGVLRHFQRQLNPSNPSDAPPKEKWNDHSLLLRKNDSPIFFQKPFFAHEDFLQQLAWRSSHPKWILQEYLKVMSKKELMQVLCWNNLNPPNTIRINSNKATLNELKEQFKTIGVTSQYSPHPLGLHLDLSLNIFQHPLFLEGFFSFQDTWSMAIVDFLQVKPGERVLDLCAAPGGKTMYLAEMMKNQGTIIAVDTDAKRLEKVKENQERLGLFNIVLHPSPAETVSFEEPFDKILLDAPCSNSGAFSRRVEARYRQKTESVQQLSELQKKILANAARSLKPNGRLVYSTCSLFMEENQNNIQQFLQQHPSFHLLEEKLFLPGSPHFSGGYVAVLGQSSS